MPYYMHELNPDFNPATGMLHHMTTDELKQLLNDDERLEIMIKDLQQVKRGETEREMLLATNKSLAEFNLSKESSLNNSRTSVIDLYNELKTLKESVEEKKIKLDNLSRQMSLDTTLALLQTSAAESEEESETLSENFLSGEIGVDTFLESYLNKRKLAHLRRVKSEKLAELLNQSRSSRNFTPPPSRSTAQPMTNNPPYPSGASFNRMFPPYPPMMPSQSDMPFFR